MSTRSDISKRIFQEYNTKGKQCHWFNVLSLRNVLNDFEFKRMQILSSHITLHEYASLLIKIKKYWPNMVKNMIGNVKTFPSITKKTS